jgi:hypothetical protein
VTDRIPVYLEAGSKRTFAVAVDWPGWARSGRDEEGALRALVDYAPRYAAALTGLEAAFRPPARSSDLDVIEVLEGGTTTNFGAPGAVPEADYRPLDGPELMRQQLLLGAAWAAFDAAATAAADIELRKGPRGGGRDLPKMIGHVVQAERSYLARLGARRRLGPDAQRAAQWNELRAAVIATIAVPAEHLSIEEPGPTENRWPLRYFVRRAAWHVLDHAWEIEDRTSPAA